MHPMIREILTIFMQALGLLPMQPARVRANDRLDPSAYSGPGVDAID